MKTLNDSNRFALFSTEERNNEIAVVEQAGLLTSRRTAENLRLELLRRLQDPESSDVGDVALELSDHVSQSLEEAMIKFAALRSTESSRGGPTKLHPAIQQQLMMSIWFDMVRLLEMDRLASDEDRLLIERDRYHLVEQANHPNPIAPDVIYGHMELPRCPDPHDGRLDVNDSDTNDILKLDLFIQGIADHSSKAGREITEDDAVRIAQALQSKSSAEVAGGFEKPADQSNNSSWPIGKVVSSGQVIALSEMPDLAFSMPKHALELRTGYAEARQLAVIRLCQTYDLLERQLADRTMSEDERDEIADRQFAVVEQLSRNDAQDLRSALAKLKVLANENFQPENNEQSVSARLAHSIMNDLDRIQEHLSGIRFA